MVLKERAETATHVPERARSRPNNIKAHPLLQARSVGIYSLPRATAPCRVLIAYSSRLPARRAGYLVSEMKSSTEVVLRCDKPGCKRRKAHVQERLPHKDVPPPLVSNRRPRSVARLLLLVVVLSVVSAESASATPQTIARPALSIMGASQGARFGDSLGCSENTAATGGRSIIAVGAPLDTLSAGGAQVGRVFIIDPTLSAEAIVQRIDSPSPVSGGEFGKAVVFIDDINGDAAQDLVISQPSGSNGHLFVFASTVSENGGAPSYSLCGSFAGRTSLGDTLATVPSRVVSRTTVIAGSPRSPTPRTDGFTISFSQGVCTITTSTEFSSAGATGSRFGSALALLNRGRNAFGDLIELLVGAPQAGGSTNFAGQIRRVGRITPPSVSPTPTVTATPSAPPTAPPSSDPIEDNGPVSPISSFAIGSETDLAGSSIATSLDASLLAFGSPGFETGRGKVSVANSAGGVICTMTKLDSENSVGLGASLAHLGTALQDRALLPSQTFATVRSETGTGGSVGLFGINQSTRECSPSLVQLNNCRADSHQEQGRVISGGAFCTVTSGTETRSLILVGSPGANNRGLVDIYVDKDFLPAPVACDTFNGSGDDSRQPPTPVVAFPGSTGLPSPNLTVSRGTDVRIAMPRIKPTFRGKAYQDAFRRLIRAGFSKTQATNALKRVTVLYAITIQDISTESKSAGISAVGALGRRPPIKKIRTRKDRVTVRLGGGSQVRTFAIAYRAEFVVSRPKHVMLGATTLSRTAKIALGG